MFIFCFIFWFVYFDLVIAKYILLMLYHSLLWTSYSLLCSLFTIIFHHVWRILINSSNYTFWARVAPYHTCSFQNSFNIGILVVYFIAMHFSLFDNGLLSIGTGKCFYETIVMVTWITMISTIHRGEIDFAVYHVYLFIYLVSMMQLRLWTLICPNSQCSIFYILNRSESGHN